MNDETKQIPGDHYLFGLVGFLLRLIVVRPLLMIGLPVLVMVIAYLATGFLRPVYPGQANLQIGRIAGADIQTRNTIVERINSSAFKARVLQTLNPPPDQSNSLARDIFDGLSAQTNPFSDWVTINSRANTPDQLSKIIDAAVSLIQREHEKIETPAIEALRGQLKLAETDIANLSSLTQDLTRALSTETEKKVDETNNAELTGAHQRYSVLRVELMNANTALTEAATRRIKFSEQLSAAQSYSTHLLDGIYIGQQPVSPRRLVITAAAGAVAFFGCLLYVLIWLPKAAYRS
jgi:hypothetical protein